MKKQITIVFMSVLMLAGTGLFAGSLDYLSNQSARWVMTTSRNAATDGADMVQFNPAGTAYLPEGLHVDLNGQTILKYYSAKDTQFSGVNWPGAPYPVALSLPGTKETLKQDYPTPILPNLFLAYNFGNVGPGKLAAYLQAGIVAGGGELKWKNGTAGTTHILNALAIGIATTAPALGGNPAYVNGGIKSQDFTATSMYYGLGLGASYAFLDDMVSVSLGGRAVIAQRSFELAVTYMSTADLNGKYEYNAKGFTPIIGVNVKPNKELTLAARFEAQTALEFKYKQKKLGGALSAAGANALMKAGIQDGKKTRQDLPHIIGLGAGYKVNNQLTVDLSGTIYMLSNANLGNVYDSTTGNKAGKTNEYFSTGWEVALGVTYKLIEQLKLGAGVMYSESGAKKSYLNDAKTILNASGNPLLDSISVGLGAIYNVLPNLDITLAGSWTHYLPEKFSVNGPEVAPGVPAFKVSGKYAKEVIDIAYGVGYKF